MKSLIRAICFFMAAGLLIEVNAETTISNITAVQRFPWKGVVDISYSVSGLQESAAAQGLTPMISIAAVDRGVSPWATNVAKAACLFIGPEATEKLTEEGAISNGTHQIVWDMQAQGLTISYSNVVFTVFCQGRKPGTQLWEDGPYWAERNVGADYPESCGYYFWWGDQEGYKRNVGDTGWASWWGSVTDFRFHWSNEDITTWQMNSNELATAGYLDDVGDLNRTDNSCHDSARMRLGEPWRMPTAVELTDLMENCTTTWTNNWDGQGTSGLLVEGQGDYSSKSIFLPAAGYGFNDKREKQNKCGYYWSASMFGDSNENSAYLIFDADNGVVQNGCPRYYGNTIRPVYTFTGAAMTFSTGAAEMVPGPQTDPLTQYVNPNIDIPEYQRTGSYEKPWKDLQQAVDVLMTTNEATIYVTNGVYCLAQALQVTNDVNVMFRPYTTEDMVILEATNSCGCVHDPNRRSTFLNFTFRGGRVTAEDNYNGGGVKGATLVDCVITNCQSALSGGGAASATLIGCTIVDCAAAVDGGGVFECNLTNCIIRSCRATGNGGGAAESNVSGCLILSNTATEVGGGIYRTYANSCTILRNHASAAHYNWNDYYFGSGSHGGKYVVGKTTNTIEVVNSIVDFNTCDDAKKSSHAQCCQNETLRVFSEGDARFVDAENGDYRLLADSPCIDYGYTGLPREPAVDLAGLPRVRGAGIDLGCYEFQRHAAFPIGPVNVSSNAQVVGLVLHAQGGWSIKVDEAAASWLSADVVRGDKTETLRLTFNENTTGLSRESTVYVYTNGSDVAVQETKVLQVGRSVLTPTSQRKGIFYGCANFGLNKEKEPWQTRIYGCDNDARFYCGSWCGTTTNIENATYLRVDADATLENLTNDIDRVIANLNADDEFMLSFSTHGGPANGQTFWRSGFCLYPDEECATFELVSNTLTRAAEKCAKAICMIDACHSAGVYKFADQMTSDCEATDYHSMPILKLAAASPAAPYQTKPKIAFIVACDFDQYSQSGETAADNGLYTAALKIGIEGPADGDGDGYIDLHELWRYAERTALARTAKVWPPTYHSQGRCYNAKLLLETRMRQLGKAVKPSVDNPLNPYYVDFVNWMLQGSAFGKFNPDYPNAISSAAAVSIPLSNGGKISAKDAYVVGYDPVATNTTLEEFTASIVVSNATPYLSWKPSAIDTKHVYTIRAKKALTNEWTEFAASIAPEALKEYRFFSIGASLRQ